jgi:P-type DNA transfer ATPase VirB11
MAADFEEESRLATDTITRQGSNPNVTMGVITGAILLAVLGIAWWASSGVKNRPQSAQEEAFNTARLQSSIGGPTQRTLAPADNRFVIPSAPPVVTAPAPAAVVIPQSGLQVAASIVDDSEAKRLAELEKLRKEHEALIQARLRSSMLVIDGKDPAASVDPSTSRVSAEAEEKDANRAFLRNADGDVSVAHAVKHQRIDALVPQGTMIRGVLETAIQSDLPGMVRAITSEDVYSFDGRRVLIPQGTMLTGEYRSALLRGQTRVFLIWTRLLRSDGVSLIINSYGTDGLGRSGLAGEVDRHFFERFGAATLLTVAGGAAQFVGQIGNRNQNSTGGISVLDPATGTLIPLTSSPNSSTQYGQQIGSQAIAQSITRLAEEALKDSIGIPPTVNVDQGTRIIVFVKKDLDFSSLYPDPVKEALYELKHPGKGHGSDRASGGALGIRRWLQSPDVIEICCNKPGEVWIEALNRPTMERFFVPELDGDAVRRIAEHVAGATHQSVNSTTPLLSAAMPHGERFQGVLSPAAPAGGAFSIRKQVVADLCLDDYLGFRAFDNVKVRGAHAAHMADEWPDSELEVARLLRDHSPQGLRDALAHAVQNHVTMVISGGTSSGKTTFLNALLKEVPDTERVISIEDTRELQPPQPNWLSLLASKGDQGTSKVTIQDLLESSLRLRPDRLFLGEIRGAEAATFLQAVNTGHPGSLTTLHADSTYSAFDRLALMTLQSDLKLTKAEILEYVRSVVPMVVQLRRRPTRGVAEIYLRCYGQDQRK